jgi:hypothetical protein
MFGFRTKMKIDLRTVMYWHNEYPSLYLTTDKEIGYLSASAELIQIFSYFPPSVLSLCR